MSKLRMALVALAVLTACNRSARDREVPAGQAPHEQQDIAGAMQPLTLDSAAPEPGPTTAAQRHSAARVHRRKAATSRPRAVQRPDSASAPAEVSAQSASTDSVPSADSSSGTVAVASRDSGASRDSSTPGDSVAPSDSTTTSGSHTSVSSDTVGYSSYPGSASPAPAARVVAAGTVIPVSLEDSINSRRDTWGKQVTGKVMQNIRGPNGEVLVRAGSPVRLTVSRLRSGRGNGKGELEIQADSITVQGHPRKLEAKVESVPYELKGRGVTGEEAAKVGVGAAGGAVVGGVVTGKTKGAVIGGVVGAAAGAAVASQTAAKDVVVAARTPVRVVLTAPLVVR